MAYFWDLVFLTVYTSFQVAALLSLRGGWRTAAAIPAPFIASFVLLTVRNDWPPLHILTLLAGGLAYLWVLLIWLVGVTVQRGEQTSK